MLRLSKMLSGGYLLLALLATLLTLFVGPLGWAPFQIPTLGPGGAPVVVTITYSTEKEQWLKAAAERFAATNPRIGGRAVRIVLEGKGSREIVSEILKGSSQPTAIIPASSIQIEQLRTTWAATKSGSIIGDGALAPQPLLISPLVVLAWGSVSNNLSFDATDQFWSTIQQVLATPDNRIKFGFTDPKTANSGVQTLLLLAYGYTGASQLSVAQVQDPAFRIWLGDLEKSTSAKEESTSRLMTDMLRYGPSTYGFITVYENLAVEALGNPQASAYAGLNIFYPPATILSDHPYTTLNAPWVTSEQRQAAALFRDFLLSREMQQLAVQQYGFRPANLQVQIDPGDPVSPFARYATKGLRLDLPPQVDIPAGSVIDALVETWDTVQR
ncbi:MAG: ABC transporter substrate-binding protein [Oscillochloris sp.]|nr:ABC transporter substrate-binding protein [Oscillochloris sp.]